MAKVEPELGIDDLVLVHEGPFASVRLSAEASKEYSSIQKGRTQDDVRTRTHLTRYFKAYCDEIAPLLNDEKFKKLGDYSDGIGSKVAVFEFKVYQWRLYGIVLLHNQKRCFVGLRVDPAKKRDRADPGKIRGTAEDAASLKEYRDGRKRK